MEFTVPVIVTVSGWISITGKNMAEVKEKAKELNVVGVAQNMLQDVEEHSECMLEEIEEA